MRQADHREPGVKRGILNGYYLIYSGLSRVVGIIFMKVRFSQLVEFAWNGRQGSSRQYRVGCCAPELYAGRKWKINQKQRIKVLEVSQLY